MSRAITQPINQVRLTNVAVVKLHRAGKRFEIACYRNKVVNWRNRVETDLDEVLQIESVYENVSKGILAKNADLTKAFGTDNHVEVCKIILDRGELQVSDKERQVALESIFRDVATIVSEKCVNPASNRPYTVSMIEKAMRDVHFSAHPSKSAKQQALEVIKRLKEVMPIDRAKMKLRVTTREEDAPGMRQALRGVGVISLEPRTDEPGNASADASMFDFLVDPGMYRDVEEVVRTFPGGRSVLDVLQLSVQQEGEADMDVELLRKSMLAVKLRDREREKKGDGARGRDARGSIAGEDEEATGPIMPAAGRRKKGRGGDSDDEGPRQQQGGQGKGASEGGVGKRGGRKSKGARRREKEEAAERDLRQQVRGLRATSPTAKLPKYEDGIQLWGMMREASRQEAQERRDKRQEARAERLANEGPPLPGDREDSAGTSYARAGHQEAEAGAGAGSTGGSRARKPLGCNTCGMTFPDTGAHREHYKSDLHRYNLKLKMKGIPPISEEEFRLVDAEDFFHTDLMA